MTHSTYIRRDHAHSVHREGRALDITKVKTASTEVAAKDFLPGSNAIDSSNSPTSNEPDLIEQLREALFRHSDVEQIFTPWHGMFTRGKSEAASFKESYVLQPLPKKPNPGETDVAFKARKAAIEKANKDSGIAGGESATLKAHRNHLHFHITLD